MPLRLRLAALAVALLSPAGLAAEPAPSFTFPAIEGGTIDTAQWRGRPVLVVNTASMCGFTPQYDGLQELQDRYAARGLVVLAVPSDDFRQELGTAAEVKDFCTLNFDLTLPMTDIEHVRGSAAHPFYRWVRESTGFAPGWNFNKILLDGEGQVVGHWGATTEPEAPEILQAIAPLLTKG